MNSFEIAFSRPWLLLLLLPVLAIVLIPFLRLPKARRNTFKKIAPVCLHSVISLCLVLIIAGMSVIAERDEQSVALLIDVSDSTDGVREQLLSYARELEDGFDGKECAVLGFGGDSVYELDLDGEEKNYVYGATDISGALNYAVSLLPADTNRRVILLSDGKQTDGDAASTASELARLGVRVDAVYFDTTSPSSSEVQISEVTMPDGVYLGDELEITVSLESNTAATAHIALYDGSQLVDSADVALGTGQTMYTFTDTATSAGVHTYSVKVSSTDDTISVNNTMYSYVKVTGEASVLIISDTLSECSTLKSLLSEQYEVSAITSRNAPSTMSALCAFDEVILVNVDENDLPSGYADLLEEYASDYGRSVLFTGGTGTYMYGNMQNTALEQMLPVTLSMTEDENGQSVALMLLLDCSMSMSQTSTYLSVAKQGAIKCVQAMSDNDYVGVISFNSTATLRSGLVAATADNKNDLTLMISGLTTAQGTYYSEALQLAYKTLSDSDADIRHVIFLSDGSPRDSGYDSVVKNMAAQGITVSTIGLGYSSSILSGMADEGGGRYYYVSSATDLPDIMLSETEQITVSSLITGTFTPLITEETELTDGISALPTLDGYLGTTIKEDAKCVLSSEDGNPVYAVWQYGAGCVACFTSDLNCNWSSEWLQSEEGREVTLNMVRTTVADTHSESALKASVTCGGNSAYITVVTSVKEANQTVTVSVASPDGESSSYELSENEPGTYSGYVDIGAVGVYELSIVQKDADGQTADSLQSAMAVSYSPEYDAFATGGEELLSSVCGCSGGVVTSDIAKLLSVKTDPFEAVKDPLIPLAVLSALMLLADIIIRKLRWRDIKDRFKLLTAKAGA